MIQYIAAGIAAGLVVVIGNVCLSLLARKHCQQRNRQHMEMSMMIAINQVRAQLGQSPAYTEDEFDRLYKEQP